METRFFEKMRIHRFHNFCRISVGAKIKQQEHGRHIPLHRARTYQLRNFDAEADHRTIHRAQLDEGISTVDLPITSFSAPASPAGSKFSVSAIWTAFSRSMPSI